VRELVRELGAVPGDPVPGPFQGGFLGALGYDLGVSGEQQSLPTDPWTSPPVVGGLYTDFVCLDHESDRAWLVLGEDPGDGRPLVATRRAALLDELERAAPPDVLGDGASGVGPLVRHVPPTTHCERVEEIRRRIALGDLYQANLAHRFTRETRGHPLDLYLRLRGVESAPYMGYLAWGPEAGRPAGALLSASPELLLECGGGVARTRPIKGTAPRGANPVEDGQRKRELLASEKDRAELAMIVDLVRNDLGRVARPGGVRVDGFPSLETYASVHHLVADVSAELARGLDAGDALAALFPGGSITGAPKLASMRTIADLEGEGRGFFTGSLGFLDLRGHGSWNILIRTLVWRPAGGGEGEAGEVSFHAGGGITWSSEAGAEELETRLKGAALAAALAGPGEAVETLGAVVARPAATA
jgi:para-aminobenzoate synthetase component 1